MIRRYGFRCGVTLEQNDSAGPALLTGGQRVPLNGAAQAVADRAASLACGERTMAELVEATGRVSDELTTALDRLGLIRHTVVDEHGAVLGLDPISGRGSTVRGETSGDSSRHTPVVLSRFASAHRYGEHLVLESPLPHYRATLWRPEVAALLEWLAAGDTGAGDTETDSLCVDLLIHASLAGPACPTCWR
ncbi:MAG: hypothetical protein ACRDTC_07835 [Pseudonocardiaceae bacterium]